MPLLAGKVTYSRTIQVRQFEPRHVSVEIEFQVGPKESFDDLMNEAKDIAKQDCLDLVNQREH
jgi:hypothetical protein